MRNVSFLMTLKSGISVCLILWKFPRVQWVKKSCNNWTVLSPFIIHLVPKHSRMANVNSLLVKMNCYHLLLTENLPLCPSHTYGGFWGRVGGGLFSCYLSLERFTCIKRCALKGPCLTCGGEVRAKKYISKKPGEFTKKDRYSFSRFQKEVKVILIT